MRVFIRIRIWQCRQIIKEHRMLAQGVKEKPHRLIGLIYRIQIRYEDYKRLMAREAVNQKSPNCNQNPFVRLQAIIEQRLGRRLGEMRLISSNWMVLDDSLRYIEIMLIDFNVNGNRPNFTRN